MSSPVVATTAASSSSSSSGGGGAGIADVRYLWAEVDRLKGVVQGLQQSERQAHDEQQRLRDYVGSFVTQAQLDAALCTKISQATVASSLERLRGDVRELLATKADVETLQALQSKKLDISVFEASAFDLKRLRMALEQSVRDLFATFAHQIEDKVSAKLSIEDFDRIFNPEARGQKAALENAATRIAQMNEQIVGLQEFVAADRQRQTRLAELNAGLLDLTRKQNAGRSAVAQLATTLEATREQLVTLETGHAGVHRGLEALRVDVAGLTDRVGTTADAQRQLEEHTREDLERLERTHAAISQTLGQIQQFTQHTLLRAVDAKLQAHEAATTQRLGELRGQQQQLRVDVTGQATRTQDRLADLADAQSALETRVRRLDGLVGGLRESLAAVQGPLLTVAHNLREENVAILAEIRRSQDESRELLLDYQGVVERAAPALPPSLSRPASSLSAAGRRHKSQHLREMAARIGDNRGSGSTSAGNFNNNNHHNHSPSPSSSLSSPVGQRPQTSSPASAPPRLARTRARTAGPSPRAPASSHKSQQQHEQHEPQTTARTTSGPDEISDPPTERPKRGLLYMLAAARDQLDSVRSLGAPGDGGDDGVDGAMFTFPPSSIEPQDDGPKGNTHGGNSNGQGNDERSVDPETT